jgi:hypothetical protein
MGEWAYLYYMTHSIELLPLLNFNVVAVHRLTGKPQFAMISAPSQVDADDFVADVQSEWIVIRDNADLLDEIQCDHCEHFFPGDEVNNCDRDDPNFHLCGDCQSDLQAKWMD